jgi:hypothetical protein
LIPAWKRGFLLQLFEDWEGGDLVGIAEGVVVKTFGLEAAAVFLE